MVAGFDAKPLKRLISIHAENHGLKAGVNGTENATDLASPPGPP